MHYWNFTCSVWPLLSSDFWFYTCKDTILPPLKKIKNNNPSNHSDSAAHSLSAPQTPIPGWYNCHITSASAAVLLNPEFKPLISDPAHSDCWLTRQKLQASKLFPFSQFYPCLKFAPILYFHFFRHWLQQSKTIFRCRTFWSFFFAF